jgi:LPXTG-site transpeptidase (sortase) family protein
LRIDVFAPSDTDLTNVSITDDLPAGVTVSNSTPPSLTGCGPTPPLVFNAPTGATSVSLTGGMILAGQRCRIDVYVTSTTLGLVTNTIPPAKITNDENRTLTSDLNASLNVVGASDKLIAMVKGFDPLTVFGGSSSTMSIELLNPGTVDLSGIAFADNMPDGMILATPVNFNVGTCGGTLTGNPGESTFSFSGGNLPASGRCTLTLSVTMTVNGNLTNTIPAGAVTTTNGVINVDPAEATLTNLPGVSLSKYFQSNPITPGSSSALTITIQNTGNIALSGLGFSDSLPSGLAISGDSAPAPVNNCGGTLTAVSGTQLIQLTNGSLDGSSACTIIVNVTGNNAGSYQNTIPAGALTMHSGLNLTNSLPDTDTLVIKGNPRGGGGGGKDKKKQPEIATSEFIIPVTGFAPGRVTKMDTASHPSYEATSLTIAIPVLKVNTSIVGVEAKRGSWDVSWLQDQVGWLNGTAYPTWSGNSVLTGHVVNADGKPGVFARLKSLGLGEYVFVYNAGYRYTYQVVSNSLVQQTDASVMNHHDKPFLTLITCDSYDDETGTYLRRVVISAALVDVRLMK